MGRHRAGELAAMLGCLGVLLLLLVMLHRLVLMVMDQALAWFSVLLLAGLMLRLALALLLFAVCCGHVSLLKSGRQLTRLRRLTSLGSKLDFTCINKG